MQRNRNFLAALLIVLFSATFSLARADSVVQSDGERIVGTVMRTNGNDVLVLRDTDILLCARTNILSITLTPGEPSALVRESRLPNFKAVLLALNKQTWASDLRQIPATVIDAGPMKNVPYVSIRCNGDYEINIYGDLSQPAAIEAGAHGKQAKDELAKSRCENFIHSLLVNPLDKAVLRGLDWQVDLKVRDDLTFEVTPPNAPDAYGGWWISIYSTAQLDASRASDEELKQITTSKPVEAVNGDASSWTGAELNLARKTRPTRITFKTASGTIITNAEVVRVTEGVSLDWRDSLGTGTVRLADLPDDLRALFGYDPVREAAESERRAQIASQQRALQSRLDANATPLPPRVLPDSGYGMGYGIGGGRYSSGGGSTYSGGPVYVRGYTRSNGTYVRAHTRSAPRGR